MAESKRIFNAGKMNRDLDDRLVPPGEYRDALNVGIGRSEGSDVGAVENLKGNELIDGQAELNGTTIGVVRDPNNDRIYWFNKGEEVDGIYEYDERTGQVNPILLDQTNNPLQKPSCTPDFYLPVETLPSDTITRPPLDNFPTPPQGYCDLSDRSNYLERADGSAYTPGFDFPENSICAALPPPPEPDPTPTLSLSIANAQRQAGTGDITLTAVPSGGSGTYTQVAFSHPDGSSNTDTTAPYETIVTDPTTAQVVTITGTVTDSDGDTATATGDAIFTADPPYTYTIGHSGTFTGATLSPTDTFTVTGTGTLTASFTSNQILDSARVWTTLPTASLSPNDGGLTLTQSTGAGTGDNLFATASGDVTAAGNTTIVWSGGVTEPSGDTTYTISPPPAPSGFTYPDWLDDLVAESAYSSVAPAGGTPESDTAIFSLSSGLFTTPGMAIDDLDAVALSFSPALPDGSTVEYSTLTIGTEDGLTFSQGVTATISVASQPLANTAITTAWTGITLRPLRTAASLITGDTAGSVSCGATSTYTDSGTVTIASGGSAEVDLTVTYTGVGQRASATISWTGSSSGSHTVTSSGATFNINSETVATLSPGTYNWTLTMNNCLMSELSGTRINRAGVSFQAPPAFTL